MNLPEKIKEILQSALKLENDGVKFYTDAAQNISHPLGKAMFKSFAGEERKHIVKLEEMLSENELKSVKAAEMDGDYMENLRNVFHSMYSGGDVSVDPDMDDLKAVRAAIDFEKNGGDVYVKALNASGDNPEREVFIYLANEEKAHLAVLENMLNELETAYKNDAVNEQSSQLEWERRLFMSAAPQGAL